ncbi:MAG: leucine-rich repeat protein [Acholeplasmataceae bacterium]|jgi:hypothetical protein|nr:leucine-rich repeat protein [Acholeplasmataceae bacterium]
MKLIKKVFTLFVFLLFLVGCNQVSTEKKIVSISIDQNTIVEGYDLDLFDISTIELIIEYNDNSTGKIKLSEDLVSIEDKLLLSTAGSHTITVTYHGFTTTFEILLVDQTSVFLQVYNLGTSSGFIVDMTYEEWLESIRGEKGDTGEPGEDGREVAFRVTNNNIQWSYDSIEWFNLISIDLLIGPKGDSGEDAKQVVFRVDNQNLQWRYVDMSSWTTLFNLSTLNGNDGEDGLTPHIGGNGNWFIGSTDTGIQALGTNGQNGLTPYIGENGNWFIGETDTTVPATTPVENMDRVGTDGLYFDLTIRNGIAGYEVVSYSGANTDIVVPNEIFGQKVISIKQGALPTSITSLSISKYTEVLPSFQNYSNLTSFDFNYAPVKIIPANAFRDANKLSLISNYSNIETIGTYGFYNTQILFNEFNFNNIVNIGDYAFYTSSVPNMNIEGVIIRSNGSEYNISDQTFIYLPETVQTIGYRAFPSEFLIYYAGNNEVVFTSEFFFKNVKQTEDGYWYVDRNTYVGLLNYTGELKEITVPNKLDGKNVTVVENFAFLGDNNLTRINLPNSITSIGNYAFVLTRQLYILHIPSSIVNISNSYFAHWAGYEYDQVGISFPAVLVVFENNQVDMNFGTNSISSYDWGRYAFGYSSSQIKQDDSFVYVEKLISAEILAIKNATGKVTIPSSFNSKPITRINQFSLIGYNGGISIIDISNGVEFISTYAFYGSNSVRYINIPASISAVNYHGFYDLDNLEIHVKVNEKPSNWDSTWYYSVKNIIWNSQINGNVSSDGLYFYTYSGNNARIVRYFGSWSTSLPLIIPSTLDGYTVTTIGNGAITYSSSSTTLEIVIPSSVTTIENQAINYYRNLIVYSYETARPSGFVSTFGYSSYWGSSSESYRSYYWQGTWSLVNNDPTPN